MDIIQSFFIIENLNWKTDLMHMVAIKFISNDSWFETTLVINIS
jgi:hypothetical protein